MDARSRALENMFNVDLLALVWILVAIVVVSGLAWHFYQGLSQEENPRSGRPPSPVMSRQARWLGMVLEAWWFTDLIWHARSVVVTPPFYHLLLRAGHGPLYHWAQSLWRSNPILWDFSTLVVDAGIVLGLAFSYRRHPRWILAAACAWGAVRWYLAAFAAPWGHHFPIGPGGFLLAALAAYGALLPNHYRIALAAACAVLAVDAGMTAAGPHSAIHVGIGVGLLGLAFGALRGWTASSFRLLAFFLALDLLVQHVGSNFGRLGLNDLWGPMVLLLAIGIHLDGSQPMASHHGQEVH